MVFLFVCSALTGRAATVGAFSGGDAGEGLDLQGHFLYAVNVGPSGATGRVGDAAFGRDQTPGVTLTAQNEIAAWHTAAYGNTANDNDLETVMGSIRWTGAPTLQVGVRLAVETGVSYKLQLLFADNSANRGYDVLVEGNVEVFGFSPGVEQGATPSAQGAVITHEFTAADDELEILLDGTAAGFSDPNPILNGFTLERLTATVDSDSDTLPDDWEKRYFGTLTQGGADDSDNDGLGNAAEYAAGSSPVLADSDGDTLSDGAEVNTHHSDPLRRDTDYDGLSDPDEVQVHGTDPAKEDTDDDTYEDPIELLSGSDPTDPASKPLKLLVRWFTAATPARGSTWTGPSSTPFPWARTWPPARSATRISPARPSKA